MHQDKKLRQQKISMLSPSLANREGTPLARHQVQHQDRESQSRGNLPRELNLLRNGNETKWRNY